MENSHGVAEPREYKKLSGDFRAFRERPQTGTGDLLAVNFGRERTGERTERNEITI